MLGCDFETFLYIKGNPIPAERVLGGTKGQAQTLGRGVVGHPDNVMAEAALAAPVEPANFGTAVSNALSILGDHVSPADMYHQASIKFTEEWLNDCALAGEVGCEPDYDTSGQEYAYGPADLGLFRYAGFHIHFDVPNAVPRDYVTRVVDCTIGLASIALEWDSNQGRRRQFYGTAGRHRVKPYGIEYRTLSSNMLNHLDEAAPIIARVGEGIENTNTNLMMLPQIMWDAVKQAIETEDVGMAQALWAEAEKSI